MKEKLFELFNRYKYLAIPIVPLIFFLLLTIYLLTPNDSIKQESNTTTNPTTNPTAIIPRESTVRVPTVTKPVSIADPHSGEEENPNPVEGAAGLIKKEQLPDGTSRFSYVSHSPARPDITIAQGDESNILFQRTVIAPNTVTLSSYQSAYGQPERSITGSNFYGTQAQTYIHATKGVSYIASPQTGYVLELHTFNRMSTSEYITKYGDDIPAGKR